MPSTGTLYGGGVTDVGSKVAWADLNNILARDGSEAVARLELTAPDDVSNIALVDTFNVSVPVNRAIAGITVIVRASDSGFEEFPSRLIVQLYDGATPIGTAKTRNVQAVALKDYDFGGGASYWGVALTRTLMATLGVGVKAQNIGAESGTDFGVDSVSALVSWIQGSYPRKDRSLIAVR